jgi:hypothetical protein
MVSGLIMFLALASPRAITSSEGGRKGDVSGIQLRYETRTEGAVIALRFVRHDQPDQAANFYSDTARPMHFITDQSIRSKLVEPEGAILEHALTAHSPDRTTTLNEYLYTITQMQRVPWDIHLAYADTSGQFGSGIPALAQVAVDLIGTCAVVLQCDVPNGESVSLEACQKLESKNCTVRKILDELENRPTIKEP